MRNEMMHRPLIQRRTLNYLRSGQGFFEGTLGQIEREATAAGVPVIPAETAHFIQTLFCGIQPQQVLEVGTAIGFSAAVMLDAMGPAGHVTTIDRFDVMRKHAKTNFKRLGITDQVTLMAGEAAEILPTLTGPYDAIFLDGAKAKYLDFLPDCLRLLQPHGYLLIDDIFQGGTIFNSPKTIKHRNKAIHRKLNQLLDQVFRDSNLQASLLPLGDGLLMITPR